MPVSATASSRYWLGDRPTSWRKRELNEPTLAKPTRKQISVTERFAARNSVFALDPAPGQVRPRRLTVGRGERPGEVEARVAGFAGHRVQVERLGIVTIDQVAGSAEGGQEEESVLGHSPSIGASPPEREVRGLALP